MPEPRGDLGHDDFGKAAAGVFRGPRRRDLRGERGFIHPLDYGAEQRFLGFEMMIQRLPRQPRGLRRLFDRRPPKAMVAKHGHRGVKNTGPGAHLTIFTKLDEMSRREGAADWRGPIRSDRLT